MIWTTSQSVSEPIRALICDCVGADAGYLLFRFKVGGSAWKRNRRQVNVLFTDMVGFTNFSERSGAGTTTYKTFQNSKIMIA
jgi:class 3 adenylate cyclase